MCMGTTKVHAHTRRQFLRRAAVGTSLVCTFGQGWQSLLGSAEASASGMGSARQGREGR